MRRCATGGSSATAREKWLSIALHRYLGDYPVNDPACGTGGAWQGRPRPSPERSLYFVPVRRGWLGAGHQVHVTQIGDEGRLGETTHVVNHHAAITGGEKMRHQSMLTLVLALVLIVPALASAQDAMPSSSVWDDLPDDISFAPIAKGTAEDIQTVSDLVAVSRIEAEPGPGVLSYYNTSAGMVGPRMLYVESGSLTAGPLDVSADSKPGPSLLVSARDATEPVVVLPKSQLPLGSGDLIFFPADTSFRASTFELETAATYLELAVFPVPLLLRQPGDLVVEGYVAQPLAPDVGVAAAYPLAPPLLGVGRLTIPPRTGLPDHATVGRVEVLLVEAGMLGLEANGAKVQVRVAGAASPGQVAELASEELFGQGTAVMLPPGATASFRNASDEPLSLLAIVIDPLTSAATTPTP